MPRRPMTEEQKRKERERERERQNSIPVIAQSNLVEVTPQIIFLDTKPLNLRMRYFKWMRTFKKWSNRFFFPLFRNETRIFNPDWN